MSKITYIEAKNTVAFMLVHHESIDITVIDGFMALSMFAYCNCSVHQCPNK